MEAQAGPVQGQDVHVRLWECFGSGAQTVRGEDGSQPAGRSWQHCKLFISTSLFQTEPQSLLQRPITVQAVGSNGRIFQFLVFQLNTTDLDQDEGIKNQVSCSPVYPRPPPRVS